MERGKQKTTTVAIALVVIALLGIIFANGMIISTIVIAVLAYFLTKGINWIRILLIIGRALGLLPALNMLLKHFSFLSFILLLLNLFIVAMLAFDPDIKSYFKYSKIK